MDYENITELDLSNQKLNELPDLSKYINLKKLDCQGNTIVRLDNLPPGLQTLYCYHNKITTLDNLPTGLQELYCYENQITTLDNLPQGLKKLDCYYNRITTLDNLPPGLQILYCSNNPLIYNFKPTLENIRNHNSRLSLKN